MQNDSTTKEVLGMEPREIDVFCIYRARMAGSSLTSRDDLPYSDAFEEILLDFNASAGEPVSHRGLWELLRHILKYGEKHIEEYLATLSITVPPKR